MKNTASSINCATQALVRISIFCAIFLLPLASQAAESAKTETKPNTAKELKQDDEAYKAMSMLVTVMRILRKYYVDQDKVSYQRLVTGALKGMLHELDPYSVYEAPAVHKKTTQQFSGSIVGIGVIIMKAKKGGLKIISPLANSPAMKAGLQAGDLILKINDKKINGMSMQECTRLIQGKPGTYVKLEIVRASSSQPMNFKIKRAVVKRSPVPYNGVKILPGDIGYIRLTVFSQTTGEAFDRALKKLDKAKIKGLIIDLRFNPGGLLKAAIDVCSRFLARGELVIFTEGRGKSNRQSFFAIECEKHLKLPIVVLINSYSASASEIVAGCLKDNKRAILIGSRSYGKGSVQRIRPLPNKGALRFTIAKYYTPAREVIHNKGIDPDIKVELPLRQRLMLARQLAKYPGTIHPKVRGAMTDVQLQRAIQVLQGIIKFNEAKND
jgi:carboxyl-terminal processing protease